MNTAMRLQAVIVACLNRNRFKNCVIV